MRRISSIAQALGGAADEIHLGLIQNLPGQLGFRLRYSYWKNRLKYLGRKTKIDVGVYFQKPQLISISDSCWIDRGVMILAGIDTSARRKKFVECKGSAPRGEVVVGQNVHIGPYSVLSGIDGGIVIGDCCGLASGVKVYAFSHHFRFDDAPEDTSCSFGLVEEARQSMISGAIVLGDNVGVSLNTVILPGVSVGRNSFIFANSLLCAQDFPENSVILGSPAKRGGPRFRDTASGPHLKL